MDYPQDEKFAVTSCTELRLLDFVYCTARLTTLLCEVAPLVPVTVIEYVPAGVPLPPPPPPPVLLPLPPPQPTATAIDAIITRQSKVGQWRRREGTPRKINAANNVPPVANHNPCRRGKDGDGVGVSSMATVEMVRVAVCTPLPLRVTLVGESAHVILAVEELGAQVRFTVPLNPFSGVTVIADVPCPPGVETVLTRP